MSFKNTYAISERKAEANRIIDKYPDRVPIVVERKQGNDSISNLDKHKYLVPSDLTIGQFMYVIRKRINMQSDKALFFFINNQMPVTSELMSKIYKDHKDTDLFLYILYQGENCFGNNVM